MNKTKALFLSLTLWIGGIGNAYADFEMNLVRGVTKISQANYDLHMLIIWICTIIAVVVYGVMFYSIVNHRKSKGAVAAQFHESTKVEIIWTTIPIIILIGLAIPATKTMIEMDDTSESDMSIKITGYQWKWRYEYLDEGIDFMSSLDALSNAARQRDSDVDPTTVPNYLLNVDNPMVVPVNKKIRLLFTAADVIHSWWVPALGWKKDAIPGYITEAWTNIEKPGIYRGQCAELCGKDHGFMPIVVIAKTEAQYAEWVAQQKTAAQEKAGEADREWTQDELITRGEEVYNGNCASCHQAGGEGVPGTFPAIKGSAVAMGDLEKHIDVVLNGAGTMMPGFSSMLPADDLAAVITFQRNALGNNVGDSVQPSAIKPLLGDEDEDE
ncbi:MAG: cytochrome c oxidase subunit II [Methylococcales bacterium]